MDPARLILIAFVVAFTAVAAYWDQRTGRLPNVLTVPALALAILFHALTGWIAGGFSGLGHGLLFALGGFATGFGILFVLWIIGGGGGGDVKLMGALGAWLGASLTLQVFVLGAAIVLAGALLVLTWHACRSGVGRAQQRFLTPLQHDPHTGASTLPARVQMESNRRHRRRLMPFGVPVALATWLVLALAVCTARV